ncbi:MAG: DUF2292 domain-containing protein [Roseburia sp.]
MEEKKKKKHQVSKEEIGKIYEALTEVQYGSVLISIQDGKIIQIDKNEKIRLR